MDGENENLINKTERVKDEAPASKQGLIRSASSISSSEQSSMSLKMKRGLLKRSHALTMDSLERRGLHSLEESEDRSSEDENMTGEDRENVLIFPSISTSLLEEIAMLRNRINDKNLNEPDIEERFTRLALNFTTDKFTLDKRLELLLRQRDIAEKNIDSELRALRESLNALNQLCTDSDMREVIIKTQQHVDIVQQATMRMSSRAETYGAIQQEQRMNCAFETMKNYLEHLKLIYDKEHIELEEYRRLLAENNLLPENKPPTEGSDDPKRILPPRSQSLSSTPKPDARTRLLSAVCLLNNSYEQSRTTGGTNNPGSVSPKTRRASLPVGHSTTYSQSPVNLMNNRTHSSIDERESRKGQQESSTVPSEEKSLPRNESTDSDPQAMEESFQTDAPDKYNKETCEAEDETQDSFEDDESEKVCRLPEVTLSVTSKPLIVSRFLRWASNRRWDNATLILHSRYALSAMLAVAATLSFIFTFVPSQVVTSSKL